MTTRFTLMIDDFEVIDHITTLGSATSGNHGHSGRPGKVGGSGSGTLSVDGGPGTAGFAENILNTILARNNKGDAPVGNASVEDNPLTIDAAMQVADVLREMQEKGYKLPDSVLIMREPTDGGLRGETHEYDTPGPLALPKTALNIYIPDTLPVGTKLDNAVRVAFGGSKYGVENFSDKTFKDIIVHEMGHVQAGDFDRTFTEDVYDRKAFGDGYNVNYARTQTAALSVSQYAYKNVNEFVAEAFVRKYRGEKLGEGAETLYKVLNGPVIR